MDKGFLEKSISIEKLIDSISEGLCICRPINQEPYVEFLVWNKHMEEITGYTMGEINSLGWHKLIYGLENNAYIEQLQSMILSKINKFQAEFEILKKDSSRAFIDASASFMNMEDNTEGILVLVKDITEKKHIERQLREIEERYNRILEISHDGALIQSEGEILYANSSAVKQFGCSSLEELIGRQVFDFIPINYHEIVRKRMVANLREEGKLPIIEEKVITDMGTIVDVEVALTNVPYEGKKCNFIFIRNISDRKRMENALKKSEERYRLLTQSLPYGVFVVKGNRIVFCNRAGLSLLGYNNLQLVKGREFTDFVSVQERNIKSNESSNNVLYEKDSVYEEVFIRKTDQTVMELETLVTAFPNNGDNDSLLVVTRDISHRKKIEILEKGMLEKSRRLSEAEEFERLRTDFFANISHELRTPVNVIFSTLQLLNIKLNSSQLFPDSDRNKKYIDVMKQNCYRLIRLINNLIDVTKIDSGFFEIHLRNENIVNIVEDITMSVVEYIENKGISLIFDTNVEEKFTACDPDMIERIVLNLISNAVKFTEPGGGIFVKIDDKGSSIVLTVRDTGIGITKEKQKLIFERFVQVDKSTTRCREGSGIGLSLVKSLVEMHGGCITVQSEPGRGSEFVIELPVRVVESDSHKADGFGHMMQESIEKINIEFSDIYF